MTPVNQPDRIYLDNAATTPLDEQVLETMLPFMRHHFGNPSSIHTHGRQVRSAIEKARKTVADLLNTSPAEIFFTSGGTEADNTAICGSVKCLGVKHIVTTALEHHAVLHTAEMMAKHGDVQLHILPLDPHGFPILEELEKLLSTLNEPVLVSLMHGNNEIGNLNNLGHIGEICAAHKAFFHSDTVQTVGHYPHNLQQINLDFMVGAAHKFHGPKGVGFLHVNHRVKIDPFIQGGAQERNMRGGTENVIGIIGLAKALEIAYQGMEDHRSHIENLKQHFIQKLKSRISGVSFNGGCDRLENSLYTVLNVSLPTSDFNDMLLFKLDIARISASGGSACSSGSQVGSHVLKAIQADPNRGAVRFSFSKYNTLAEIDTVVDVLEGLYATIATGSYIATS